MARIAEPQRGPADSDIAALVQEPVHHAEKGERRRLRIRTPMAQVAINHPTTDKGTAARIGDI